MQNAAPWCVLSVILILACVHGENTNGDYTNMYTVQMDLKHADDVKDFLKKVGFEHLHQVADFHIFRDLVPQNSTTMTVIRSKIKMKIRSMKRVRKQYLKYEPEDEDSAVTTWSPYVTPPGGGVPHVPILMCAPYYDALQGIDDAWKLGYTGKGVVVAVTDCGFTVDHRELCPNINLRISNNFDDTTATDLSPGDHGESMLPVVNHGNECCSVIAGVYNNNLCGAGAAHSATLAVLKIGHFENKRGRPEFETDVTKYGPALAHKCEEIDIYSNSWGVRGPLSNCPLIKAFFSTGINKGRGAKGSIYVFPSGDAGDCLSSSVYTISVGGLNYDRSLPGNTVRSSATLVSAFSGQDSTTQKKNMVTAFLHRYKECTNTFGGTSAATAVVAGITALVLQANSNLTWRDVQHVLVQSAQNCCSENFKLNAAGHYFHDILGYGIVNATKAVLLAEAWNMTSPQVNVAFEFIWDNFRLSANITCTDGCVERVEHVIVMLRMVSNKPFRMTLRSPGETDSTLAHCDSISVENDNEQVETLSVNFWDEPSAGVWTLVTETCYLENGAWIPGDHSTDVVTDVRLVIYGTGIPANNTATTTTTTDRSTTPDHPQRTSLTVIAATAVPVSICAIAVVIRIVWIVKRRDYCSRPPEIQSFEKRTTYKVLTTSRHDRNEE